MTVKYNEANGGSAFPDFKYEGMTLLDHFAGLAMQGMLACPVQPQSGADMYARDAYVIAAAMLAERNKP